MVGKILGKVVENLVTKVLAPLFPKRYRVIPGRDGQPLLRQFKITDWCYLQSFVNAEKLDLFHVHRWKKMYSIVLSGAFVEERYPGRIYKVHEGLSFYSMDDSVIHRVEFVAPETWTCFFMFGNKGDWGYFPRPENDGYIPWDKVVTDEIRVKSL